MAEAAIFTVYRPDLSLPPFTANHPSSAPISWPPLALQETPHGKLLLKDDARRAIDGTLFYAVAKVGGVGGGGGGSLATGKCVGPPGGIHWPEHRHLSYDMAKVCGWGGVGWVGGGGGGGIH